MNNGTVNSLTQKKDMDLLRKTARYVVHFPVLSGFDGFKTTAAKKKVRAVVTFDVGQIKDSRKQLNIYPYTVLVVA